MAFIKSFSINTKKTPFNIPAVRFVKNISLDTKVTIFVGDNGTGKSTLLESLALHLNLPLIGGHIGSHEGFEAAGILQPFIQVEWKRQTTKGFFFRAEDFSDFINSVQNDNRKIAGDLSELKGVVDDAIIKKMSDSMNYSLRRCEKIMVKTCKPFPVEKRILKSCRRGLAIRDFIYQMNLRPLFPP